MITFPIVQELMTSTMTEWCCLPYVVLRKSPATSGRAAGDFAWQFRQQFMVFFFSGLTGFLLRFHRDI